MSKKDIDLSDIKKDDLEMTSSFTDLMSRKERRNRHKVYDDLEEMIEEKKKSTKDLTIEVEEAKEKIKSDDKKENTIEDDISNTQILDIAKEIKSSKQDSIKAKTSKKGATSLTIIGISILAALASFIYLLLSTNYLNKNLYLYINGGSILIMFFLFGISIISNKKFSALNKLLIFIMLIGYIMFNALNILNII